jgi:hypothetical protein
MQYSENIVTYLMKVGITEPEDTAFSMERPVNTLPRQRNESGTVGAGVSCLACPERITEVDGTRREIWADESEVRASQQ